jgi:two-component system chemotaxis response regulator CheB
MIRIVIIDDSPVSRAQLQHFFDQQPDFQVVGWAANGKAGVEEVKRKRPDLVTMDLEMPVMDGYQATRVLMEEHPLPIIVVSGVWVPEEVHKTFKAHDAGAVAIVEKPAGTASPDHERQVADLVRTVRAMAEVKVVRRRSAAGRAAREPAHVQETEQARTQPVVSPRLLAAGPLQAVLVGASTGGPPVLKALLERLPPAFPLPLVVVQHISPGFLAGLTEWLAETSHLAVSVARHLEPVQPGHVYFAADGRHLGLNRDGVLYLSDEPPEHGMRPSVSYMFRSAAANLGARAVGVLLTGMGRDGALELGLMRENGAVTFAQDEQSCTVFGMPGEAVRLGAAVRVLPVEAIADELAALALGGGWDGRNGAQDPGGGG